MNKTFNYDTAFSRNIGWVTEAEQSLLRTRRVAIAGLGGVGGSHLITLTRMGIGNFNISDMDNFGVENFNRQAGASLSHVDRPKVDVMAELALDINPELNIRTFPTGIEKDNLDDFLEEVDIYVDGLDFFAFQARRAVFAACAEKGIPAVTAAPLGMGSALLCFLPGKMTFEEYFKLEGQTEEEQLLRFLLGLSPLMLQMPYLVDDTRVDLGNHKGPSTPMACELCSGLAATFALKILLKRGNIPAAPRGVHFDAFRNKLVMTWRPAGNNNPLQRLGIYVARKKLAGKLSASENRSDNEILYNPMMKILDRAKWAPSGDNTQPWRFQIIDDHKFLIHVKDTREWCVYDLDGHATQIATGALLENISIAASNEKMDVQFELKDKPSQSEFIIEATLREIDELTLNHLLPYLKERVTQRRSLSTNPLTANQKGSLEEAVGNNYRIIWMDGNKKRQMAWLLYRSAQIHLSIPEGYEVHKRVIEWNARFSEDRIPDQAVGLDPIATKLMKWAVKHWWRVKMLNRYFAGTLLPRLELNLIPALRCAAHFAIISDKPLQTMDDYLQGGRAVQRFWLTATQLGLQLQPEMAPLIFSRYVIMSKNFTSDKKGLDCAKLLTSELRGVLGEDVDHNRVFMGRIGVGNPPYARSTRLSLSKLLIKKQS